MDNIQANEQTVKEFIAFLDNDLNFIYENLELMNKQLNDELNKIVKRFTTCLDEDFEFVKENLGDLNQALNEALKGTFKENIKRFSYFKEYRFSPLKSNTNVMGYKKITSETAYTYLLSHFLRESEFRDKLFKSILFLLKNHDEYTLKEAECEARLQDDSLDRLDVLCICNENEDGKNELVIEAKIKSKEGKDQTERYYKAKQNKAFGFVYLTVEEATPKCKEFKNITWLDLAAAFYAGYNSYKFSKTDEKDWSTVDFSKIEDSNDGIFFQMWLSNILTHLYDIEDIEQFNDNDYNMFIMSARFMEKYKEVMEAINGKQ